MLLTTSTFILLGGCLLVGDDDLTSRMDLDGDGFDRDDDCDDDDPDVYPGATERCDRVDRDCDGVPADGGCLLYSAIPDGGTLTDLFISDLDGTNAVNLTQSPDLSESNAWPSPDRQRIVFRRADEDGAPGGWWQVMPWEAEPTPCFDQTRGDYDDIDGIAWFGNDFIMVNRRGSTSPWGAADLYTRDCEWSNTLFTSDDIEDMDPGCCGSEYQVRHFFGDSVGDFIMRGFDQNWEPTSDIYRVRLALGEVTALHEDGNNNHVDNSLMRVNHAETQLAWSHNFTEGWYEGDDADENDFAIVTKAVDGSGELLRVLPLGPSGQDVIGWTGDDASIYVATQEYGGTHRELLRVAADGSAQSELLHASDQPVAWWAVF